MKNDGAGSCVICMEEYEEGDEVACLPCGGLHKAHFTCLSGWLERAATCPSCRYALPSEPISKAETEKLMKPAASELDRLRAREPAPCQLAEETDADDVPTRSGRLPSSNGNAVRAMAWADPAGPGSSALPSRDRYPAPAAPSPLGRSHATTTARQQSRPTAIAPTPAARRSSRAGSSVRQTAPAPPADLVVQQAEPRSSGRSKTGMSLKGLSARLQIPTLHMPRWGSRKSGTSGASNSGRGIRRREVGED